jgi:hypothetical protein
MVNIEYLLFGLLAVTIMSGCVFAIQAFVSSVMGKEWPEFLPVFVSTLSIAVFYAWLV